MIYRTTQEVVNNYFNDTDHVSQSNLKQLLKGVNAYLKTSESEKKLYYTEKGHYIIGSGVDTILSMGNNEFDNQYHIVSDDTKPGDKSLSLIKYLFDTHTEQMSPQAINDFSMSVISNDDIIAACKVNEFQSRYKDPALLKAVYKYEDYFNELCISHGKQIITFEDKNQIDRIVDSFETSKWAHLFDDSLANVTNIDLYFQLPIYGKISNVKVKGLLDLVIVDHSKKLISIIDFKTTGEPVIKFKYSAKSYRYDFQAAWYTKLLTIWLQTRPELAGYKFGGFSFLVESSIFINGTVMQKASAEFLKRGKYGTPEVLAFEYEDTIPIRPVKVREATYGWTTALQLYKWHVEHGFDQDKEVIENNNILTLE